MWLLETAASETFLKELKVFGLKKGPGEGGPRAEGHYTPQVSDGLACPGQNSGCLNGVFGFLVGRSPLYWGSLEQNSCPGSRASLFPSMYRQRPWALGMNLDKMATTVSSTLRLSKSLTLLRANPASHSCWWSPFGFGRCKDESGPVPSLEAQG